MELISREAVKQAVRDKFKDLPTRCEINEVINLIPTVEERKESHWCYEHGYHTHCFTTGFYVCSVCHSRVIRREGDKPTNFCPNCGAYMKGE